MRPEDLINAPLNTHAKASLAKSQRWFGPPAYIKAIEDPLLRRFLSDRWMIEHQAFGLAGECGEVIEHVKKWHRGDFNDPDLRGRLATEIPDVLAYLLNLSAFIGLDLDKALADKQEECEERWRIRQAKAQEDNT